MTFHRIVIAIVFLLGLIGMAHVGTVLTERFWGADHIQTEPKPLCPTLSGAELTEGEGSRKLTRDTAENVYRDSLERPLTMREGMRLVEEEEGLRVYNEEFLRRVLVVQSRRIDALERQLMRTRRHRPSLER